MRQVFTSPRLENVEAVAALLRDAGIEVKITQPRSYRGQRRSSFTYRESEDAGPQPAAWIVHADDQPRGRQLLRDAGLLDSSRAGESSYLPLSLLERDKDPHGTAKSRRATRIKLGLLAAIVAVIGLLYFSTRKPDPSPAPASAPVAQAVKHPAPAIVLQSADDLPTYRAEVPTALATLLVEGSLATRAPAQACIAIDGKDPPPPFMQSLRHDAKTALFTASQCPGEAAWDIDVHDYMTDGSGRGSVQLMLDLDDAQAIDVERDGARWRVLRVR